MKQEGLGLRAIARCLEQMKVPTKSQGKKWHPEMVKRILVLAEIKEDLLSVSNIGPV